MYLSIKSLNYFAQRVPIESFPTICSAPPPIISTQGIFSNRLEN